MAAPEPVPAILMQSSPLALEELETVVSKALNGMPVTLAPNVLMKKSTLIIERAPQRSIVGIPAGGRMIERPHHFNLMSAGDDCLLVHQETNMAYKLDSAECRPAPPA